MIQSAKDFWASFCLTYRKSVLFVLACITAFAFAQLPTLHFDNAMDVWFLDDDSTYLAHREMVDTYASDELIVVGLEAPDVFAPRILELIDRVGSKLAQAPHVEKVISLTTIESIEGRPRTLLQVAEGPHHAQERGTGSVVECRGQGRVA